MNQELYETMALCRIANLKFGGGGALGVGFLRLEFHSLGG